MRERPFDDPIWSGEDFEPGGIAGGDTLQQSDRDEPRHGGSGDAAGDERLVGIQGEGRLSVVGSPESLVGWSRE